MSRPESETERGWDGAGEHVTGISFFQYFSRKKRISKKVKTQGRWGAYEEEHGSGARKNGGEGQEIWIMGGEREKHGISGLGTTVN
jgi:hypothetical protein